MVKKHSKIAIVIGTKAELIKCVPVMIELQNRNLDYWFVHTGQHPLGKACEDFGVKKPDLILSPEPKISTKFWSKINKASQLWFFKMIFKVKKNIKRLQPKYVVYHGDTMSTAAASIGSSKFLNWGKNWKNVHLEAGLRSGSIWEPFPEEISRNISSGFSDLLLAVSDLTESNLRKERKTRKKEIIKVGNTIIDSSLLSYEKGKKIKRKVPKEFALINIHRHENIKDKKRLQMIIEAMKDIKIDAIWPLHDNTRYYLEKYNLMKEIKKNKKIEITPLISYFEFIYLLDKCKYLFVDGGSIQEESLVFKKPCILLRKVTERQEGLETGINFLTEMNLEETKKIIRDIEANKLNIKEFKNPYGEPGLSKKIVERLLE